MNSTRVPVYSLIAALCLAAATPAWAEKDPMPLATDARIRFLVYDEFQVFKVVANYGYATTIEFGADEMIETVSAGDTISWQIVPSGRRLFLKPMERDAHTNMTVITTKHTYNFDLDAVDAKPGPAAQTYLIKFRYDEAVGIMHTGAIGADAKSGAASTPGMVSPPRQAGAFNFDYRLKGDKDIMPTFVFDDGTFTYFQFADPRNRSLPAIFIVDKDGNESVVNYRIEGEYMVVERIGGLYTLRASQSVVCVQNQRKGNPAAHPQEVKDETPVAAHDNLGRPKE
jgi:type IV secretion system protein VirB9